MAKRRARRCGASEGFTLLEVVVAMAILAIGLLSVAAAQLAALHMSAKSRNLTVALHLAQQKLEEFQSLPFASLPASGNDANNPIDPDPTDLDETVFSRSWTVQSNTPVPNVSTLRVQVDWVEPKTGLTRTTTLESMKAQ